MGVPKGAGNLRGARDKNWTVVAACLRSFRRALTAVHPEPARGPTLVTSATQLKIGEPCEFSANHENRPEFLDVTLQSRPTENGVSPPLSRIGCSAYSSSEAAASGDTPTKPRHKEDSCAGEEVVKARA